MEETVTDQHLDTGLRQLGIAPGEVVLVHSSLRAFGRVEGGARAVVQTLLNLLGEAGTLVVPTLAGLEYCCSFLNRHLKPSALAAGR